MIDSYSFGNIIIDGKKYSSDVIIYPDKIDANWWRKEGHLLQLADLGEVFKSKPEVVIVGTGKLSVMKIDPEVEEYFKQNNIKLIVCNTEMACRKYNEMSGKNRVVAALHLTC